MSSFNIKSTVRRYANVVHKKDICEFQGITWGHLRCSMQFDQDDADRIKTSDTFKGVTCKTCLKLKNSRYFNHGMRDLTGL